MPRIFAEVSQPQPPYLAVVVIAIGSARFLSSVARERKVPPTTPLNIGTSRGTAGWLSPPHLALSGVRWDQHVHVVRAAGFALANGSDGLQWHPTRILIHVEV